MELLYLYLICFFIFSMFALSTVIKLKKDVKKLNGIVEYLLKNEQERKESDEIHTTKQN